MTTKTMLGLGLGATAVVASGFVIRERLAWTREIQRVRRELLQSAAVLNEGEMFREEMVHGLPDPARSYLLHAIQPGTRLTGAVELDMSGSMRIAPDGPWLSMRAHQILAPPEGFLWEATVRQGLMRFSGADLYVGGSGRMDVRLGGIIPVARARGPDTDRSARGRLAGEAIWTPAALLPQRDVRWEPIDERSARVTLTIGGDSIPLTLEIQPDGALRSVFLMRWGNRTADGRFDAIPFGMELVEEATFDGHTVPVSGRGGWWYGTDRYFDFFHPIVIGARFL